MIKTYPKYFFLLFVVLVTAAFLGLIEGFFMAVFWATVFAILFSRRYESILSYVPTSPNLAASLTMVLLMTVVIVPFTGITIMVINEANEAYATLAQDNQTLEEHVDDLQDAIPIKTKTLRKWGISSQEVEEKIKELRQKGTEVIVGSAVGFTQNIFLFLINFFLMLYTFFFFIRDGKRLVQELMWVIPISDRKEEALFHRFESVARATVKGSLLVALVQGILGGFLFFFLGIPSAFLWGVIMTFFSLLPIGSAVIWGPYAILFFIDGDFVRGTILIAVGAGFIGVIDNFMRPFLVGRDTKLPDYLILLSTLGGIAWFGISGFVIGPIVAALFVTCWKMMGTEFGKPRDMVVTEPTAEEIAAGEE